MRCYPPSQAQITAHGPSRGQRRRFQLCVRHSGWRLLPLPFRAATTSWLG
jgi:hypothetical protein